MSDRAAEQANAVPELSVSWFLSPSRAVGTTDCATWRVSSRDQLRRRQSKQSRMPM